MRQHEFTKALTAIDVLEKKLAGNPLPHTLRGQVLLDLKDVPGARKSFERALAINPAYFRRRMGLPAWTWPTRSPMTPESTWKPYWPKTPSKHKHC